MTHPQPGQAPAGGPILGQPSGRHTAAADDTVPFGPPWRQVGDPTAPGQPDRRRWEEQELLRREQEWQAERQAARVRGAVASRLQLFNVRHADHAWRLRNSFGLAPSALVLVYVDPQPAPLGWEVKVAGKLFPDTDQVTDPLQVLYDLTGLARETMAAGIDPRTAMSENPDPMSPRAIYQGVALSTLDTPAGPWREIIKQTVGGGMAVPGRVLCLLADNTMLQADRYEHRNPEHYQVAASNRLDAGWGGLGRLWRYVPELAELRDQATRPLWLRLRELHLVLSGASYGH